MTDKSEAKGKLTKEELQEYKEKVLMIMQDTFAASLTGMISPVEFLNMVPMILSMVHAIFHELGERTWKCEADTHDHIFEQIDRLYSSILKDREEDNDVVSWIDDPVKAKKLEARRSTMVPGGGFEESADAHLS